MKTLSLIPLLSSLIFAGCQSPSTRYTNGLILWCGSTAIGIGWGEYTEVAAGGKLKRTLTGKDGEKSTLAIDNSLTPSNGQADGAEIP
jgi:hypothetical protein